MENFKEDPKPALEDATEDFIPPVSQTPDAMAYVDMPTSAVCINLGTRALNSPQSRQAPYEH